MGCQWNHDDAFRVHKLTWQPDGGSGMELYHGLVDSGGETESREFLHAALSLHSLVMPLVIAGTGSLSILTLDLSTSLQWSVTSHLKAIVRAVYCTLDAVILVFMGMHPAFWIFKSHK